MLDVTCAIIFYEKKILVTQRSSTMSMPFKWEFPGGKVETSEREEDCLKREILEELNIEIDIISRLSPNVHHYPTVTIRLIPFIVNFACGKIKLSEHIQFKTLHLNELSNLDWADADIPILKEFLELYS
ncbi:MAG: (deoxy)nucleoside triphosphate pyrophosphohydrolase [Flavobacterium sp.]|uniref:(deoxy)nucleoside triphosphate pyrophosphohydrolase n=1 Tax=Flavobacterium sp. TaxID=239 RepID=UPI0012204C7A|nr:(deoxy)nucleoside triphosphate pyrophosphohydrolase [Flavobacterium sp.]RZJ68482.1 MAG: (deoxy)nucleoside triphosphate pyrophosphohydrolase [Flavobacterium sp.]